MMSKREQVYFEQGWRNFVADNELKDGEFLTFVFDGQQSYEVSIYGRGDCKETRAIIHVEEISDDTEGDKDSHHSLNKDSLQTDDEIESDSDYSPDNVATTSSISVEAVEVVDTATMTSRSRLRDKKTIENPEQYLDDPNNLCFETSLKIKKLELLVHGRLVKDYCLEFGDKVEYIDGHGKLTAKATKRADQRVCVNKWQKIRDRNKLTENDSILCELLRNDDQLVYAIKIHIIRDGAART